MCGIAGIVSLDGRHHGDPARVRRMNASLAHRGPDGAGLLAEGPVVFGHRRLAIVDIDGGRQPMGNEDGTVWVVFNGEIYNHAALRDGLLERGHCYRTRSDTETIVHLYEEYGDAAFGRLQGMFAIAIWDGTRHRVVLARDRLGIKPLYYAIDQGELTFGSEIKALFSAGVPALFNEDVLPEFLANRYVAAEDTFFRGVRRLSPGHLLTWSPRDGVSVSRYWTLPRPAGHDDGSSLREEGRCLQHSLDDAVRRHLMSDVPLGIFLSGGIDSSALAALAARASPGPIQTFAVGFAEEEANERPYARLVADAIGAEHREVCVTSDEYFDALPDLIWHQDEPMAFSSGVPLYFVSRLARDHVKVVLTGEGADELFLGYNRYRVSYWNSRLSRTYGSVVSAAVRTRIAAHVHKLPRASRRYAARTFLALEPGDRSILFDNFAVFSERAQRDLLPPARLRRDPYGVPLRCYNEAEGGALDRLSATDLQTYLCELLTKQDRMSMAASIESRVPFLDDNLVAEVVPMPVRFKLRGWRTKAVLRHAVRDLLPPEILTRRKMGFPVPLGRWLATKHWPVVEEFVLGGRARERGLFNDSYVRGMAQAHHSGAADHAERLWLLINLEIWQRVFCEGEAPAEVMRPVWHVMGRTNAPGLDQSGWTLAAQHRRPSADVPDTRGVVPAP